MAKKSRDAFRTISEVADWLDVPTHVLRFWESRFSQIKPVKRAGGRRYYRPSDMRIIGGVKVLLHDQGMTIRGVQKLFREEGLKHVSSFSPALFGEAAVEAEPAPLDAETLERAAQPAPAARTTHVAEPDPVAADPMPEAEDEAVEAAPLFRHSGAATETPTEAPTESAEQAQDDGAPAAESAAPEPATIPPTPDVPDHDPADDEASFAAGPGVAARLATKRAKDLLPHRAVLEDAANKLKALLDKAS